MSVSGFRVPPGRVEAPSVLGSWGGSRSRRSPLAPGLDEPAGFTLTRLVVLLVVVIAAARFLHASPASGWALVAAVTVWALASSAFWLTPLAGAGMSWLLGTGFLAHRTGELSFTADDRGHLVVVAVAALAALLVCARARSTSRSESVERGARAGRLGWLRRGSCWWH